jgi:hypothetical protein
MEIIERMVVQEVHLRVLALAEQEQHLMEVPAGPVALVAAPVLAAAVLAVH